MITTTPSQEKFDKWILQEYEINCDVKNDFMNICYKDDMHIQFQSSHFRNAGLYASYEKTYRYDNGEKVTFRTFGVLGALFKIKEGFLWELLN